MIQTFYFRTEISGKRYHHTVHSKDVQTAIKKWIEQIECQKNEIYSIGPTQTENIKKQYFDNQLIVNIDKEPFFLSFQIDTTHTIVCIDKVNKGKPDFLAKVTYLSFEAGGRKNFVSSGYRPQIKFDGRDEMTSGEQLFSDKEIVIPGENAVAEIRILGSEYFKGSLYVGQCFTIAEASHIVGHGEIIEIINMDLDQASR